MTNKKRFIGLTTERLGVRLGSSSNEHVFVLTSLPPPGVVIQLDGHGAERLAMTFSRFIAAIAQVPALAAGSRNDR